MSGRLGAQLELWRTRFLGDPAGFIAALPQPWRAIGLLELTVATWIIRWFEGRARTSWRLAFVDAPGLAVAFDRGGEFLAATEAAPGAPGLLRLRSEPARVEAHGYGGEPCGPARLTPWNGWATYSAMRAGGSDRATALKAAWPTDGPRLLPGGGRLFAPPGPEAYRAWLARNEPAPVTVEDAEGPCFVVVTRLRPEDPAAASMAAQTWPLWRLSDGEDAPAPGEVVLHLEPGDRLAPDALQVLAAAFRDPAVAAVYADEDRLDAAGGGFDPVFKTAFDPERLARQDYIGDAIARRAGAAGETVRHVPRVLWRRAAARDWPITPPAPLSGHGLPKVLAVIPTRDRPDLLRGCMAGLLERTDYPGLEICIVDNGSVEPDAVRLLRELATRPAVRVLRIDGPFDYPALNNAAVEGSDAEVLMFLNDDTWVIEPDWLAQMAVLAARDDVGAVGAKLFYPDGRIQHAGVSLGLGALGVAGHGFRGAPGDFDGPQRMLKVVREVSAATGACLAVGRDKFAAVGGFDSTFQVAFNDVDLCLRLAARGWKTLWTPHARMVHLESASRGREVSPERTARLEAEAARMRDRWGERLLNDPYYHPALSLTGERFALGETLRSVEPR